MFNRKDTPPPDHPHRETLQCWKRVSDSPCKCRLWMDVTQEGDASTASRRVQGCFFELFPWLISGAIVASNSAMADVNALRHDVQDGLTHIGNNVAHGFNVLAQRMQLLQAQQTPLLEDGKDE
jgi:hypothetical protein